MNLNPMQYRENQYRLDWPDSIQKEIKRIGLDTSGHRLNHAQVKNGYMIWDYRNHITFSDMNKAWEFLYQLPNGCGSDIFWKMVVNRK